MKFHVSRTWGGDCYYDVIWQVTGPNTHMKLGPYFLEHDLCEPSIDQPPNNLVGELKLKVLFETVKMYLSTRNFDDAYRLTASCKDLTNLVFYWVFGRNQLTSLQRILYLKRIFYITQQIYDRYMTEYRTIYGQYTPAVTVTCDLPNGKHLMPWDMKEIEVLPVRVDYVSIGEKFSTGHFMGDDALIMGAYEKGGEIFGENIAFPFCFFLFMEPLDYLKIKKMYNDEVSMYYFTRWTMLLKFCFGGYMKSFFYTHGVDMLDETDHEDNFVGLIQMYKFKWVEAIERK